jgi:5'-nucleotidase
VLDRILLTNDDGIDAPGLAVLADIAAELAGEVWVVAPQHDQSGVSHAISLHHPLRVVPEGERRYGVTGTPGDCVVMGVCHLMREAPPDLILSGVNRGANLGMETVFSGTVGGAMTGMMLGIPSIGLSQVFTDRGRVPWDVARTLGAGVIRQLLAIGWSAETCLNVNFPDRALDQVGPPTLCRQVDRADHRDACRKRHRPARDRLSLDQLPPCAARAGPRQRRRRHRGRAHRRHPDPLRPHRRGGVRRPDRASPPPG